MNPINDEINDETNLHEAQLLEVKTLLSHLAEQVSAIQVQLQQLPTLAERLAQLEGDISLVTDVQRYGKLRHHLAAGQWFEADQETIRLVMEIAGQADLEELTPNDIQKFPCNQLQIIDKLWLAYSHGRFGFSVQAQMYRSLGGTLETTIGQDVELVERWGEHLGWRKQGRWKKCSELDYSLNAPMGCHPSRWWNSPYGSKMTNYFLSRLLTCQL
ncbi:MAG: GUN4 domain-containing protein [Cyanothece sp. SIO1E1]|nr:GUN4 domain-containing protein [Cyanothece sp. SIO1E1]